MKLSFNFILSDEDRIELINNFPARKELLDKSLGSNVDYCIKIGDNGVVEESINIYVNNKPLEYISKQETNNRGDYKHRIDPFDVNNVSTLGYGHKSIINFPYHDHSPRYNLIKSFKDFFNKIYYINPTRSSVDVVGIAGDYRLKEDGSNLPQVLFSVYNSDSRKFNKIESDIKKVINDVSDIRTPLLNGTTHTQIVISEDDSQQVKYPWGSISSGLKEVICLITMIHLVERDCLILIEEPEVHLHVTAIRDFVDIILQSVEEKNTQLLITSHSPNFIDKLQPGNLYIVSKEGGKSNIVSLEQLDFIEIYEILIKEGVSLGAFLNSNPSFILIVEGKDDHKIYENFLKKEGLDPKSHNIIIVNPETVENGGWTKAIEYGKLIKKIRLDIPYLVTLDNDTGSESSGKIEKAKDAGFRPDEYYILESKDIEDYLINVEAIAKLVGKPCSDVNNIVQSTNGRGKEKLRKILKALGTKDEPDVKALIVNHLDSTPDEIKNNVIKNILDRKKSFAGNGRHT